MARAGVGKKKKKTSLRKLKQRKRNNSREKLALLVESSCEETRRHRICNSLGVPPLRWKLFWQYKDEFIKGQKNYRTFDFVADEIRRKEFATLKSSLEGWVKSRKCISDKTLLVNPGSASSVLGLIGWITPGSHVSVGSMAVFFEDGTDLIRNSPSYTSG